MNSFLFQNPPLNPFKDPIFAFSKSMKTILKFLQASMYISIKHLNKKIASWVVCFGIKLN